MLVDDAGAVAAIEEREEGPAVIGSGELVRSPARPGLVDSVPTTTGVVIGTYGEGEDA
ncbi:hypothetical protein [Actinomadura sp. NTSP31]|uniref:hypothetical protein n=1 Tax=Actinomadura sp. NTSP31 TaxID=1735447 RepID=UPI0035C0556A